MKKMSKHLEYRLEKFEKVLAFQITEQSEEFTAFVRESGCLLGSTEEVAVEIYTSSCPEIYHSAKSNKLTIYLRGRSQDHNFTVVCMSLADNTERDKYYNIMEIALQSAILAFEESLLEQAEKEEE